MIIWHMYAIHHMVNFSDGTENDDVAVLSSVLEKPMDGGRWYSVNVLPAENQPMIR